MINEIIKYDKDFTVDKFKTYIDNVFVQITSSVMTKTLDNVKHFMSDNVYKMYFNKINELNEKNFTQIYDELNVKETNIISTKVENETMIIEVELISRYMDYLIDSNGNLVRGDNTCRVEKSNRLIFEKKATVNENKSARTCPGCGSNIDVNANGKCPYCGTIYDLENKDWILTSIITN